MVLPIQKEIKDLLEPKDKWPSISIIFPFEPKMSVHNELEYQMERIVENIKNEIKGKYTEEIVLPILDKLQILIHSLDYSTFKKSVAIFVSSKMEKIYYFDFAVEEKVIIDSTFDIRDLVSNKKDIHSFLLLVISSGRSRIYMGDSRQFIRISSVVPEHENEPHIQLPCRLAKSADPTRRKEIMLEKFLRQVDNGLDIILKAYNLPLFIMGTYRVSLHFKKITHHADRIIGFISGNADESDEQKIKIAATPFLSDWKKVKQEDLLHQLDKARELNKLVTGIHDILKHVNSKKAGLLVVELNYSCNTWKVKARNGILLEKEITDSPIVIEDLVDDIIEKIIENGGDVEFVEEGLLKDYMHIGLIK